MTLKEFAEALGVSRNDAARLALKIPGAKREAVRPGQIPMWVLPDDALDCVDETMIKAAKEQANSEEERQAPPGSVTLPAGPADSALADEELAVRRERLLVEKIRAETLRLQAEAERRKVEQELSALNAPRVGLEPVLDRLARFERRFDEAVQRPDSTLAAAEILKALSPVLTPLIERAAAPGPASTPSAFGLNELLALADRLKTSLTPPDNRLRSEIREAFREGLEIGRERARGHDDGGDGSWSSILQEVVRGLGAAMPGLVQGARDAGLLSLIPGSGARMPSVLGARGKPETDGGATAMAINPEFKEMLDALIDELSKPKETRDVAGIASFLDSIVFDQTGSTLLDRFDLIARAPERLAQITLKAIDPRLVLDSVWPGVLELLLHVKQLMAEHDQKGGDVR